MKKSTKRYSTHLFVVVRITHELDTKLSITNDRHSHVTSFDSASKYVSDLPRFNKNCSKRIEKFSNRIVALFQTELLHFRSNRQNVFKSRCIVNPNRESSDLPVTACMILLLNSSFMLLSHRMRAVAYLGFRRTFHALRSTYS